MKEKYEPIGQELLQLEILSDIIGVSVDQLCPEDKLNYHVPLLYVLDAMTVYKHINQTS